ncbi:nicotinamide riboside transporter PnuC [Sphingomonas donggukensis]|uniref:Nicotinamide riboside transporter PnuC n=1 Tax=Sphingomonas donggukensis TaxID=2949093 RepID=A0ABY4TQ91_9SPHN|nr:nicotinamide riboside transporter PnuC [Sphingomonas donggukensis]URW74565.1 nicotinamide riboside transporter PnuC [Sphingomonas donggukensis]
MTSLEWVAAALGLICVALAVRRNLWNYAFGIASTGVLAFVVFDARLYSQALLQLFFVAINAYGFLNWRRAKADGGEVAVERMSAIEIALWLAAAVVATLGWGLAMDRLTDAAQPLGDAAIAVASVAAQLLMARRKLENWLLWIAVDVASVPLFLAQGLTVVAGLYLVYLALAVWGLVDWRRAYRLSGAVPA